MKKKRGYFPPPFVVRTIDETNVTLYLSFLILKVLGTFDLFEIALAVSPLKH